VSTFRRLDLDDDGRIELSDLTELQRPVQLHVRVNAVFTAFDTDCDGAISQAELEQAFSNKKP
jgi:Ca2+-binding EF-hand superfamily protein